jgi:hypothetical protein
MWTFEYVHFPCRLRLPGTSFAALQIAKKENNMSTQPNKDDDTVDEVDKSTSQPAEFIDAPDNAEPDSPPTPPEPIQ